MHSCTLQYSTYYVKVYKYLFYDVFDRLFHVVLWEETWILIWIPPQHKKCGLDLSIRCIILILHQKPLWVWIKATHTDSFISSDQKEINLKKLSK